MAHETLNVSRFHAVPAAELSAALECAIAESDSDAADAWVALFRNRGIRLIRTGTSTELRDEAAILNRHLFGAAGRGLLSRDPEYHARLRMVAEMVGEAAQRPDRVFVGSILDSNRYARSIVEMLHRNGEGVPRQKIMSELRIPSESYLSHILADLEDANVVVRHRRAGTKGVYLTLGPAGHDVVEAKLLPKWFLSVMKLIEDAYDTRVAPSLASVTATLDKASVPSRLFATHVSKLLAKVSGEEKRQQDAATAALSARATR